VTTSSSGLSSVETLQSNHRNEYMLPNIEDKAESRYKRINFTRSAHTLSHPIFMTSLMHRSCSHNTAPVTLSQAIQHIATKHTSKILILDEYDSERNVHQLQNMGVSTFSFDSDDALVAIGYKNGIVKIYDSDEIFYKTMRPIPSISFKESKANKLSGLKMSTELHNPRIIPVVVLDTKKSISSIAWRKLACDHICISFDFSPQILHYDLTCSMDDDNPFQNQQYSAPLRPIRQYVPDGLGNNSCGHPCIIIWNKATTVKALNPSISPQRKEEEFVIAGSTNGFIRSWKLLNAVQSGSNNISNKCYWNLRVDATKPISMSRPIIALFLVDESRSLLVVTDDGLLTKWDLYNLKSPSFGSTTPEPKLLSTFSLANTLVLNPESSGAGSRVIKRVIQYDTDRDIYLIQLEESSIFLLHYSSQRLLHYPHQYDMSAMSLENIVIQKSMLDSVANLTAAKTTRGVNEPIVVSNYEDLAAVLSNNSASTTAKAAFVPASIVPLHSLSSLQAPSGGTTVLSSQYSYNDKSTVLSLVSLDCSYQNSFYHYSTNAFYRLRSYPCLRNIFTGCIESSLQRSVTYSYTLPARVISASVGDCQIMISSDLSNYLCNFNGLLSSMTRSNEIRLEYYCDSSPQLIEKQPSISYKDYTIESIRPYYLTLSTPYEGPTVVDGYPRVWLRTNLHCKGWSLDSYYFQEMVNITKAAQAKQVMNMLKYPRSNSHWAIDRMTKLGQENSDINLSNQVVTMAAHPSRDLLFVAHQDDSISIMTSASRFDPDVYASDLEEEEQVERERAITSKVTSYELHVRTEARKRTFKTNQGKAKNGLSSLLIYTNPNFDRFLCS
jgi:hypothetical protein